MKIVLINLTEMIDDLKDVSVVCKLPPNYLDH